jgi:hypothetical protein
VTTATSCGTPGSMFELVAHCSVVRRSQSTVHHMPSVDNTSRSSSVQPQPRSHHTPLNISETPRRMSAGGDSNHTSAALGSVHNRQEASQTNTNSFTASYGQFRLDPDIEWAKVDVTHFNPNPLCSISTSEPISADYRRYVGSMTIGLQTVVPFLILGTLMFFTVTAQVTQIVRSNYLATGSVWIAAAVAEIVFCMCASPQNMAAEHSRNLRHEIIETLGWLIPTVINRLFESLFTYECPAYHPPYGGGASRMCRRMFRGTHCMFIVGIALNIRRPERAAAVLFLMILADVLHPILFPHEAHDWAYRFAMSLLFTAVTLGFNIARDLRMRGDFGKLIVIATAQDTVDRQRADLHAAIRAAIPSRLLERLIRSSASPQGQPTLANLADSSDNALVCVTEAVAFAHLATTTLLKETVETLHELFTYFDTAVAAFGLDQATTYGDRYVVTAGLIQGSRSSVVEMCRFALWQVTDVGSRLQAPLPLHSVISAGELRGGLAGSSTLRYVLDGAALENALEVLASVPTGSVYASRAAVASDPAAILEDFHVKVALDYPHTLPSLEMRSFIGSDKDSRRSITADSSTELSASTVPTVIGASWYVIDTRKGPAFPGNRRTPGNSATTTATRLSPRGYKHQPRQRSSFDGIATPVQNDLPSSLSGTDLVVQNPLSASIDVQDVSGALPSTTAALSWLKPEDAGELDSVLDLKGARGEEMQRVVETLRSCELRWFSCKFVDPVDEERYVDDVLPRIAADLPGLFMVFIVAWSSAVVIAVIERASDPSVSYASPGWMDAIAFSLLGLGIASSGVAAFLFLPPRVKDRPLLHDHSNGVFRDLDGECLQKLPRRKRRRPRIETEIVLKEPVLDLKTSRFRVLVAQIVCIVITLTTFVGLFFLQRSVVSASTQFLLYLLLGAMCGRLFVTRHAFVVAVLAVVCVYFPANATSTYHAGGLTVWTLRIVSLQLAHFILSAYLAYAGCAWSRRANFVHLHATQVLGKIQTNADVLERVLGRLLPHYIAADAAAVLHEQLAERMNASWSQKTARQRLDALVITRGKFHLDAFMPDFVCMEVCLRVASSTIFATPHANAMAAAANATSESAEAAAVSGTAALLQRWEAIGRLIEEAAGDCLHHVQALGDRFTVGGPFSESDRNERIAAVGCVRLLAQLARVLDPTTDSFTAAAVVEEAFAAIVGECSLRYRCFGVAPLHSSALLDAGLAAQRYAPRSACVAYVTRTFARTVGPTIEAEHRRNPMSTSTAAAMPRHKQLSEAEMLAVCDVYGNLKPVQPVIWFPMECAEQPLRSGTTRICDTGPGGPAGSGATFPVKIQPLKPQMWRITAVGVRDVYGLAFERAVSH